MRGRNWISGGLALILIFSLAGCSLAQPERPASGLDEFIGFYLVYEDAMVPPEIQLRPLMVVLQSSVEAQDVPYVTI